MLTPFDQDMAMNDNPDSNPFNSGSQPIRHSGLEGCFSLQPQAPAFVGRQTLQEYERDYPKNDLVARAGQGSILHKAVCDPSQDVFPEGIH